MKSYLTGCTQMAVINGKVSSPHVLEYGVPQGSVLGYKNFKRYSKPIGIITRKHRLGFYLYTDDSQLYVTFSPKHTTDIHTSIERIQNCVKGLQEWMSANYLKCNGGKTEIRILSQKDISVNIPHVHIGDSNIEAS